MSAADATPPPPPGIHPIVARQLRAAARKANRRNLGGWGPFILFLIVAVPLFWMRLEPMVFVESATILHIGLLILQMVGSVSATMAAASLVTEYEDNTLQALILSRLGRGRIVLGFWLHAILSAGTIALEFLPCYAVLIWWGGITLGEYLRTQLLLFTYTGLASIGCVTAGFLVIQALDRVKRDKASREQENPNAGPGLLGVLMRANSSQNSAQGIVVSVGVIFFLIPTVGIPMMAALLSIGFGGSLAGISVAEAVRWRADGWSYLAMFSPPVAGILNVQVPVFGFMLPAWAVFPVIYAAVGYALFLQATHFLVSRRYNTSLGLRGSQVVGIVTLHTLILAAFWQQPEVGAIVHLLLWLAYSSFITINASLAGDELPSTRLLGEPGFPHRHPLMHFYATGPSFSALLILGGFAVVAPMLLWGAAPQHLELVMQACAQWIVAIAALILLGRGLIMMGLGALGTQIVVILFVGVVCGVLAVNLHHVANFQGWFFTDEIFIAPLVIALAGIIPSPVMELAVIRLGEGFGLRADASGSAYLFITEREGYPAHLFLASSAVWLLATILIHAWGRRTMARRMIKRDALLRERLEQTPEPTPPAPPAHHAPEAMRAMALVLMVAMATALAGAAPTAAPVAPPTPAAAQVEPAALGSSRLVPDFAPVPGTLAVAAKLHGDYEFTLERDLPVPSAGQSVPTLRWPASQPRAVPGCFTAQDPALREFVGAGWYRIELDLANLPEGYESWTLRFEGIARESEVHVLGLPRGAIVRKSLFAYTPVELDLPNLSASRQIVVAVRASNEIPELGIPDREWDGWWNHAGIFRDVELVGHRAATSIARAEVRTLMRERAKGPGGGWLVAVMPIARRDGAEDTMNEAHYRVRVTAPRYDANEPPIVLEQSGVIEDRHRRGFHFELPGDAGTWLPSAPRLGKIEIELLGEGDAPVALLTLPLGLREVWLDGSRAILNGVPMRLFGFSYHEILPDTGYTMSEELIRADLTAMKAMGANFLRAGHYPLHPLVPQLCDELGLVLWEEIPAWKTSAESLSDRTTVETYAFPYLREMIRRDGHHPSVLFWGVGNEFDSADKRVRRYIDRAIDNVRSLDPTRFAVFASDRREKDIALDLPDVIAVNEYFGWYYGEPSQVGPMLDALHAAQPEKAILVSEFGHECEFGLAERHPGARRDYSEPAQADFLRQHIQQIFAPERAEFMMGGCVWLWADFDDPHRTEKHHPKHLHGVNTKGVVTAGRERKASYRMLEEIVPTLGLQP